MESLCFSHVHQHWRQLRAERPQKSVISITASRHRSKSPGMGTGRGRLKESRNIRNASHRRPFIGGIWVEEPTGYCLTTDGGVKIGTHLLWGEREIGGCFLLLGQWRHRIMDDGHRGRGWGGWKSEKSTQKWAPHIYTSDEGSGKLKICVFRVGG